MEIRVTSAKKIEAGSISRGMWKNYFACLAGSGGAAFSERATAEAMLELVHKARAARTLRRQQQQTNDRLTISIGAASPSASQPIRLAYIGTATYDGEEAKAKQTARFEELGVVVRSIDVAWPRPAAASQWTTTADWIAALRQDILAADCVLVSGGNTLYAIRRWKQLGLDAVIREAAEDCVAVCGGSFGLMCLMDGGHSDSADPTSFRPASDNNSTVAGNAETADFVVASASAANPPDNNKWEYIATACLGLIPGFVVPHQDRVQSNGISRHVDVDKMMLAQARREHQHQEQLLSFNLDHWCAIILPGDGTYKLFAIPGKDGSVVLPTSSSSSSSSSCASTTNDDSSPFIAGATHDPPNGIPGAWMKRVVTGKDRVERHCIKPEGKVGDIFIKSGLVADVAEETEILKRNPLPVDA